MPSPELWCGACEDRGTVPCPRCAEEETNAECPLCDQDLRVPCPDCTEREIVEMDRETLDVLVRQRNDAEAEAAAHKLVLARLDSLVRRCVEVTIYEQDEDEGPDARYRLVAVSPECSREYVGADLGACLAAEMADGEAQT